MKKSRYRRLNWRDIAEGFGAVVVTTSGATLLQFLDSGVLPTGAKIKAAAIAGVAAGMGFLLRQFYSNSRGDKFSTEPSTTGTVTTAGPNKTFSKN